MTERGISKTGDVADFTVEELKLSEKEAKMLKDDILELQTSLAQLGLMVVGLIPGWGEPADATSAAIDFATGHPISGSISLFCACPFAGLLGDIPLAGIRIYRVGGSTLKCGKTMFILAKKGGRAKKIFIWFNKKIVSYATDSKVIQVIQKNIFDPFSSSLYEIMPKLDLFIKERIIKIKSYTESYPKINLSKYK